MGDNGWDLSLVGGPDFFVGRLSGVYWGGYWCGKWHVARPGQDARKHDQMSPNFGSGDSWSGWDHLGWHHMAVVFSGSSAIVYIDGKRVVVFTNTGECQKQISFLGSAQFGIRNRLDIERQSLRMSPGLVIVSLEL